MSSAPRVTILLEDQLAKGTPLANAGPTRLIKACVADWSDALGRSEPRYELDRRTQVVYQKGNGNVLRQCRKDSEALCNSGPVIAVLDRDRAHKLWELAGGGCRTMLLDRFSAECDSQIELVFLEQNLETVVSCIANRLNLGPMLIEQAVKRKDLNQRDSVLNRAVGAQSLAVRQHLLHDVPSFERLIDKICHHLGFTAPTP